MAIAAMDMVLRAVLAQGNKEQNQAYPPQIFEAHFNMVTAFLLDEIAKLDPVSRSIVEIGKPFFIRKQLAVKGGMVNFPDNYRSLRGLAVFVTDDFESPCDKVIEQNEDQDTDCCGHPVEPVADDDCAYQNDPLARTVELIEQQIEQGKCRSRAVTMVDHDEWDDLTIHPYKGPTLREPIGCIFQGEGIKICPYDVPSVEMRYIRQPQWYKYNYAMNPDDTYYFSRNGSTESEWTDNATQYLIKGVSTLYSLYTRDGELRDGILELKKAGIF